MRESTLVHDMIRSLYGTLHLMRANVGSVWTKDGRRFSTGLPKGFPDLFGVLPPWQSTTGEPIPVFIECKVGSNKPTPEQIAFIKKYREMGCIAGVCYSVDDAYKLLKPYIRTRYTAAYSIEEIPTGGGGDGETEGKEDW